LKNVSQESAVVHRRPWTAAAAAVSAESPTVGQTVRPAASRGGPILLVPRRLRQVHDLNLLKIS